ncbi:hypothetical protein [Mycetohabitans endofungorum]|uniref:hypothetical protein n=1 Tax=Mycetohabitans endofungorum TaxID=417203 RepID=UPI0030CFC206
MQSVYATFASSRSGSVGEVHGFILRRLVSALVEQAFGAHSEVSRCTPGIEATLELWVKSKLASLLNPVLGTLSLLVIGAHFWLLFTGVPVEPLALGLLGNIEGVLIAMVLGAKEFFLGSSFTAKKQAAVITSFAMNPGTYVATQVSHFMGNRIETALPSSAEAKP